MLLRAVARPAPSSHWKTPAMPQSPSPRRPWLPDFPLHLTRRMRAGVRVCEVHVSSDTCARGHVFVGVHTGLRVWVCLQT